MTTAIRPQPVCKSIPFWNALSVGPRAIGVMICALAWVNPIPASADCFRNGDTVECNSVDFDGFLTTDAGLTLFIKPDVTVRNLNTKERRGTCPLSFPAVSLGNTSTVTNSGRILTIGVCGTGIQVGTGSTVTNDGLIDTDDILAFGIEAGDGSSVTNTGTIQTRANVAYGIFLDSNTRAVNTVTGVIDTTGTVSPGLIGRNNVAANNEGRIFTAGQGSHGIDLLSDGTVTNSGQIEVSGFQATGIRLNGGSGSITNSGSIIGTYGGASDPRNPEDGIQVVGTNMTVNNSGAISMNAPLASAIRLDIVGVGNGIVSNMGSLAAPNGGIAATALQGRIQILNMGTISALGSGASAIALNSGTGGTSILTNQGLIRAQPNSVAIMGGDGSDEIANSGIIIGNIVLGGGDDRVTLQTGSLIGEEMSDYLLDGGADNDELVLSGTGDLAVSVLDFEEITKFGQGQWVLNQGITGVQRLRIVEGELTVASATHIESAQTQVFSNGKLMLSGQLSGALENQGVLAVSQGAHISGSLLQTDSGTLLFSTSDRAEGNGLTVTGEAILNGRLRIDVSQGPLVQDGEALTLLRAGTLAGTLSEVEVSGSAFVTGTAIIGSETIGVHFKRQAFQTVANTKNGRAVARALDATINDPEDGARDLLGTIDRLSLEAAGSAFNNLATGTPSALLALDFLAIRSSLSTFMSNQSTAFWAVEAPLVWGEVKHAWGSFDGDSDGRYNHHRSQITAGVDLPISPHQVIGFSITATESSGATDASGSDVDGTSTLLGARYALKSEKWQGKAALLVGDLSGETERLGGIDGAAQVLGTLNGRALAMGATVSRIFDSPLSHHSIEGSIHFVDVRKKPFSEIGKRNAVFSFQRTHHESVRAGISVNSYIIVGDMKPSLRLGLSREISGTDRSTNGALSIVPEERLSFGLNPEERTWLEWGIQMPFYVAPGVEISFTGSGVLNDKTHGQSASLRAAFHF